MLGLVSWFSFKLVLVVRGWFVAGFGSGFLSFWVNFSMVGWFSIWLGGVVITLGVFLWFIGC